MHEELVLVVDDYDEICLQCEEYRAPIMSSVIAFVLLRTAGVQHERASTAAKS